MKNENKGKLEKNEVRNQNQASDNPLPLTILQ